MGLIERSLGAILRRNWWVLLLRGLVAIAFGVLALFFPASTGAALVWIFGVFVLVDGVLGVGSAVAGRREHDDWWLLLLAGLVGIGVGILALAAPGTTALALVFLIAIWAVAKGLLEIVAAIHLRKEIEGEWVLIAGGLASLVLGVLLMAHPGWGVVALLWLVGIYAVVSGVVFVVLAFRARAFGKRLAQA